MAWEYVRRLARLEPRLPAARSLTAELLSADPDSIELWSGRPQLYFESMRYADDGDFEVDSLA